MKTSYEVHRISSEGQENERCCPLSGLLLTVLCVPTEADNTRMSCNVD